MLPMTDSSPFLSTTFSFHISYILLAMPTPTTKRPEISLTNEQIIERCRDSPDRKLISNPLCSVKVVQLDGELAVKCGSYLKHAEAINQAQAYEMLDSSIVRVPYVHRFFTDDDGKGYIVMELISGVESDCMAEHELSIILGIIKHLATFKRDIPGPVDCSSPSGLLFESAADITPAFNSILELEDWWDLRLCGKSTLSIRNLPLVFCHLDIAPRNIIWQANGIPALIDWASAGYFPHFFEYCLQKVMGGDQPMFAVRLAELLAHDYDEETIIKTRQILWAWQAMQRYLRYFLLLDLDMCIDLL